MLMEHLIMKFWRVIRVTMYLYMKLQISMDKQPQLQ